MASLLVRTGALAEIANAKVGQKILGLANAAIQQHRNLNVQEHVSYTLLNKGGIATPKFGVAKSAQEAKEIAKSLKTANLVVKAQVLAGGRGVGHFENGFKGGVRVAFTPDQVAEYAGNMVGHKLITKQTGAAGRICNSVMVGERKFPRREFYFAVMMERAFNGPVIIASSQGGVSIEDVAAATPEAIIYEPIDITLGLHESQARHVVEKVGLEEYADETVHMLMNMYKLFEEKDALLIEINPYAEDALEGFFALDAKFRFDDNAEFRQKELFSMRDWTQEDPKEVEAAKYELNYIALDGSIGCMVNGAGLAMATLDIIKLYGGDPANFLDVGGGATAQAVKEAFKIITSDPKVHCILVNIFGGIMRCDVIAEGIVAAAKELNMKMPIVCRLQGTNVDEAREIIRKSNLRIIPRHDLDEAANLSVHLAKIVGLAREMNVDVAFEIPDSMNADGKSGGGKGGVGEGGKGKGSAGGDGCSGSKSGAGQPKDGKTGKGQKGAKSGSENVGKKTEKVAKKTEKVAEKTEKDAKKTEKDAKKTEKDAKKTEKDAKKIEKVAKKTEKDAKKTEKDAKTEKDVKKTEKVAKKAEVDAKKTEKVAKKTEQDAKKTEKDQSSSSCRKAPPKEKEAKQADSSESQLKKHKKTKSDRKSPTVGTTDFCRKVKEKLQNAEQAKRNQTCRCQKKGKEVYKSAGKAGKGAKKSEKGEGSDCCNEIRQKLKEAKEALLACGCELKEDKKSAKGRKGHRKEQSSETCPKCGKKVPKDHKCHKCGKAQKKSKDKSDKICAKYSKDSKEEQKKDKGKNTDDEAEDICAKFSLDGKKKCGAKNAKKSESKGRICGGEAETDKCTDGAKKEAKSKVEPSRDKGRSSSAGPCVSKATGKGVVTDSGPKDDSEVDSSGSRRSASAEPKGSPKAGSAKQKDKPTSVKAGPCVSKATGKGAVTDSGPKDDSELDKTSSAKQKDKPTSVKAGPCGSKATGKVDSDKPTSVKAGPCVSKATGKGAVTESKSKTDVSGTEGTKSTGATGSTSEADTCERRKASGIKQHGSCEKPTNGVTVVICDQSKVDKAAALKDGSKAQTKAKEKEKDDTITTIDPSERGLQPCGNQFASTGDYTIGGRGGTCNAGSDGKKKRSPHAENPCIKPAVEPTDKTETILKPERPRDGESYRDPCQRVK